jgi:hypothetical protein
MGFSGLFFLIGAVANAQSIQTRAQAEELIQSSAVHKQAIDTQEKIKIQSCYQNFASNPCIDKVKRQAQMERRAADQQSIAAQRWLREDSARQQQQRLSTRPSNSPLSTKKQSLQRTEDENSRTAEHSLLVPPKQPKAVNKRAALGNTPSTTQIKENQQNFDTRQRRAKEKAAQSKKRQADRAARNLKLKNASLLPRGRSEKVVLASCFGGSVGVAAPLTP